MAYSNHDIPNTNIDLFKEEHSISLETLTPVSPNPDIIKISEECSSHKTNEKEEEADDDHDPAHEELVASLPKGRGWMTEHLVHYKGYWLTPNVALKGLMLIKDHFQAQPNDIFLATFPKCGTTWLKALIFATMNRSLYDFSSHPLLNSCPHDCFPFLEAYDLQNDNNPIILGHDHRLFATHIPYALLPSSMTASSSRFVYVCRNPKDVLVSKWVFMNKVRPKELPPISLEEAFELFCEGVSHYGPFWDHVLGYWEASLESPRKILFLRYEEMKKEPIVYLKRLAEFLGQPFSVEEERAGGPVHEIVRLCSFENLSSLEVNQENESNVKKFSKQLAIRNCDFFRKGEVGDWENHLTKDMIQRLDEITNEKFQGSGLMLN